MIILGIDPGLHYVGWATMEGETRSLLDAGSIKTSPSDVKYMRFLQISEELKIIIEQFNPHEIAIENSFVNINSKTSLILAEAKGAIMLTVIQAGLTMTEYAATTVKKAATGRGDANKAQMSEAIYKLFPSLLKVDNHAIDAISICLCHYQMTLNV